MATAAWLQNNSGIGIDTSGKRCLNRFSIIFEFLTGIEFGFCSDISRDYFTKRPLRLVNYAFIVSVNNKRNLLILFYM